MNRIVASFALALALSGCWAEPWRPRPGEPICENTCGYASDGECDDGGPGSLYSLCDLGTDCNDCGVRGTRMPLVLAPGSPDDAGACAPLEVCAE